MRTDVRYCYYYRYHRHRITVNEVVYERIIYVLKNMYNVHTIIMIIIIIIICVQARKIVINHSRAAGMTVQSD